MRHVLVFILTLALLSPTSALAGKSKKAKKEGSEKTEQAEEKKGPFKPFDEVTKDTERHEGFFDLYTKAGHVYMAVPEDRLGDEFLMGFEVAKGIGRHVALIGGAMLTWEGNIVALERHGDKIFLVQKPTHFRASDEDEQGLVDLAFGESVLETAEIASIGDDKTILIDVYKWFVSDLSGIGEAMRWAVSKRPGSPGRAQFDAQRSYLENVKVFPENINFQSKLTFKPGEPVNINSVPDPRYIPISIYTVLAKLPEVPMEKRVGDDRVGYFLTTHKDYSREEKTFFARYCRRWRLEPGKKRGDLYAPKEPIIYYMDRNIPPELRPYVKAGIEEWNLAFEEAGFKNAVQADLLPIEADAEDIRYPTIRWVATDRPSYGAIGPSMVDPRTGEVLDADILFDASIVMRARSTWRQMINPAALVEQMFAPTGLENGLSAMGFEHAAFAEFLQMQCALVHADLLARGEITAYDPVPAEFIGEFLKFVVMHEVGHTLGLRHNFRGSVDTPMEKLHDRVWTSEHGLVNSVMEYPAPNIAANGSPNGHYYTKTIGTYDRWAIAYGYTPDAEKAKEMARLAAYEGRAYATDEDNWGAGALDPTVNVWDLGEDPLAWAKERTQIVRQLWKDLPQHVLVDDAPRYELTNAMSWLMGNYFVSLAPAVKYVGGQYQYRDHVGDPNGRMPFVAVPKEKQQEALNLLMQRAFSEDSFALPQEVLSQMGANRWSHWGQKNTFDGRIDFPLHEIALSIQNTYLRQVMHPLRLSRISDGETKFGVENVLTIPELMGSLTGSIWSEVYGPRTRNITSMRRNLQRLYVDHMTTLLTRPPARTPADVRSVARMQLQDLKQQVIRAVGSGTVLDDYTKAHLSEVQERIDRALEAGLEVEMMRPRG